MPGLSDEERLQELEDALHELLVGKQVREVTDSDGTTVKYNWGNKADLEKEIARLRTKMANQTAKRGALGVFF